jgi:hypothetical protein
MILVNTNHPCLRVGHHTDVLVSLLQQLGDWLGNFKKVQNEPSIIVHQLKETRTSDIDIGNFQSNTSFTLLGSTAILSGETT